MEGGFEDLVGFLMEDEDENRSLEHILQQQQQNEGGEEQRNHHQVVVHGDEDSLLISCLNMDEWLLDVDIFSDFGTGFDHHSNETINYPSSQYYDDDDDEAGFQQHEEQLIPVDQHPPPLLPPLTFGDINNPQQQQQQQQLGLPELVEQESKHIDDHEEEEEEDVESNEKKLDDGISSKNLVSERSRRKRLNQQLFALRSIVPNITKMDKRSILVDALAYLQSILQQTKAEMEKINSTSTIIEEPSLSTSSSSSCSSTVENNIMEAPTPPLQTQPPPYERSAALPAISKIGVEKLDEERFILKIAFNKALGAMGQVQRSIQMLGLEITNISVYEQDQHHMETMNFLRVKKKGLVLTEENLLHRLQNSAKQLGLLFISD